MTTSTDQTLYGILGVPPDASPEQITTSYRALAKRHHPDRGGDAVAFMQVQTAYEVLRTTESRATYDNQLRHGTDEDATPTGGSRATGTDEDWTADNDTPVAGTRADRYGYPESTTRPRPSNGLLTCAAVSAALLLLTLLAMLEFGTVGIILDLVILAAIAFRIMSAGDAERSRKIVRTTSVLIALFGVLLLFGANGGWKVLGVPVIALAVLLYLTIERLREFRADMTYRHGFLVFLDEIRDMDDVGIYVIEYSEMAGQRTRVSMVDATTMEPAGPKSLWGVWRAGMIVAVDSHHRVRAAAFQRGVAAANTYRVW